MRELPPEGSPEMLWYRRGLEDEAEARDALPKRHLEVRNLLEALSLARPNATEENLSLRLAQIMCPKKLKPWYRVK